MIISGCVMKVSSKVSAEGGSLSTEALAREHAIIKPCPVRPFARLQGDNKQALMELKCILQSSSRKRKNKFFIISSSLEDSEKSKY